MTDQVCQYPSGEPIRTGDVIAYAGRKGRVLFVLGQEPLPPQHEWFVAKYGRGFMIDAEGFGNMFLKDADDDLELLARSTPYINGSQDF